MNVRYVVASLALGMIAIAPLSGAGAVELEQRGDFYYDPSDGSVAMTRHVDVPADFPRQAMSFKEKFEMLGIQLPERRAVVEPRMLRPKPSEALVYDGQIRDRVYVKFMDEQPVRLRAGVLRTNGQELASFEALRAHYPEVIVERMFSQPEYILDDNRETGERISGKALADLNNYYILRFPDGATDRSVDLTNELLALDVVEEAYLPAKESMPGGGCTDISPTTPLWEDNQFYLDPAPAGIDADYAWAYHGGGNGNAGFWVVDCEWAWCFDHEDLAMISADVVNGSTANGDPDFDDPSHGTAVLGEYGACDNGYGVTGISSDVTIKMADRDSEPSWASNIQSAVDVLLTGEIALLEVQLSGPSTGTTCPCNCSQFEDVPVEWDSASWNTIQTATANGIIIVEAAGNGSVNLDLAVYGGWFASSHNSGAIIVGAALPGTHNLECFTNYGQTVDVHAYGSGIYSTGYGGLFASSGCTQDYTTTFGGTSGASPIIVGAAASLQGISNSKYGLDMSASLMRSALRSGGTPQGTPTANNIGPMPDLRNAINYIEPDLYPYTPSGWDYAVVPRSIDDGTGAFNPLQTGALPGNVTDGTFISWATQNSTFFAPTAAATNTALYIDELFPWFCPYGTLAPGGWGWCKTPNTVKGGRHTLRSYADYTLVEAEYSETNNQFARQFIWSPLALTADVPVTRTDVPYGFTEGYGPYPNAEGFRGSTSNYWHAFAVLPVGNDDFDVRLNTEVPSNIPQAGFGAYEAWSSDVTPGDIDFVVLDRNTVGSGTYYGSVINYTGTSAGNKVVEWDADQGLLIAAALGGTGSVGGSYGPFTIQSGDLIGLHELSLPSDAESRVQVEVISGNADFGISVLDGTSGYHDKFDALPGGIANAAGAGEDEYVIVTSDATPPDYDFHGLVVWKTNSAQLGQSLTYMVHVSADPNLRAETPTGWFGPVVPRNTTDATTTSAPLPAMLTGNETTTSFNWAIRNQGANDITTAYNTRLYVDDVFSWQTFPSSTASGAFTFGLNSPQGNDPFSLVRGGRHHIRSEADALDEVVEFDESDNEFTDWFVWTPLEMPEETPVQRAAPPVRNPLGWGPAYSVDGVRMPAGMSSADQYWAATGVLSLNAADQYEARLHEPSTGSRDGFGGTPLDWSYSVPGESQWVVADFNTVTRQALDVGVVNWNAGGDSMLVQSTLSVIEGSVPLGYTSFGDFVLDAGEVLNIHEIFVEPSAIGTPMDVSVDVIGGNADVGLVIFDGTSGYHSRQTAWTGANSNGPGQSETVASLSFPSDDYYAIGVFKTGSADAYESCTYRLRFLSEGTVDAPETVALPARFELRAARPNPFAASTIMSYGVPEGGGDVDVSVFDTQGRRVAQLVDGFQPAGVHALRWDGRDASGRRAVPGVYFVRFSAPNVSETQKITFLD